MLKYAQSLTGEHVDYSDRMEELLDEYLEREHKTLEAVSLSSLGFFSLMNLFIYFWISSP